MKKKRILLISALLLSSCVVIMYSCTKANSETIGGTTAPTATSSVSMKDMQFVPSSITVAKGTVITWTNNDPYAHTVTSNDNGSTFDSQSVSGGDKFSYTANTAGTIPYHCLIHGLPMSGTIIVTP